MGVKYAILGLLHYKPMHGYKIKELLERNFGYMWTVNFGQIYPTLREMLEQGLVTQTEMPQSHGPSRKQYAITPKGRDDFSEWLHSPVEGRLVLRDPFLLRMTFFGFGESEQALALIREQIAFYETQLEAREAQLPQRERGDVYVRQLADLGMRLNTLMLDWLGEAQQEIEAQPPTAKKGRRRA